MLFLYAVADGVTIEELKLQVLFATYKVRLVIKVLFIKASQSII